MSEERTITIDGKEITLSSFLAEFGDVAPGIVAIASVVAKSMTGSPAGESSDEVKALQAQVASLAAGADVTAMREEIDHMNLINGVRLVHSDVDSILPSEKFGKWLGTQPESVQKLAQDSGKVEDACYVVAAFKEHLLIETRDASGKDKTAQKKKTDDILAGKVGEGDGVTRNTTAKAADDFGAGFDEEDKA